MFFGCSFALSFRLSGLGCPVVAWAGSSESSPFVSSAALVPGALWVAPELICFRSGTPVYLFSVAGQLFTQAALVSWLVSFQGVVVSCSWRVALFRALRRRPAVLVLGSRSLGFGLRKLARAGSSKKQQELSRHYQLSSKFKSF